MAYQVKSRSENIYSNKKAYRKSDETIKLRTTVVYAQSKSPPPPRKKKNPKKKKKNHPKNITESVSFMFGRE